MTESHASPVWYAQGLSFECTQCGRCCGGAPGAVWVSDEEIGHIAEFCQMSVGEFEMGHTRLIGARRSLRERPNGDCEYLHPEHRNCTIYPVRPIQCRTWPFWNSNLESEHSWKQAGLGCPGINRGNLVPLETIQAAAAKFDI